MYLPVPIYFGVKDFVGGERVDSVVVVGYYCWVKRVITSNLGVDGEYYCSNY